jgi:hypothetical protein
MLASVDPFHKEPRKRQPHLERLALIASGHDRPVNGSAAVSGEAKLWVAPNVNVQCPGGPECPASPRMSG